MNYILILIIYIFLIFLFKFFFLIYLKGYLFFFICVLSCSYFLNFILKLNIFFIFFIFFGGLVGSLMIFKIIYILAFFLFKFDIILFFLIYFENYIFFFICILCHSNLLNFILNMIALFVHWISF